jgi:hypothetical protein
MNAQWVKRHKRKVIEMISRYDIDGPSYQNNDEGDWFKVDDIKQVFNSLQFPQLGDDFYIDGFNKAYELLYKAIFEYKNNLNENYVLKDDIRDLMESCEDCFDFIDKIQKLVGE